MSATPWIKWFPGDFLNGVSDMSPNEGWAYVMVLNLIYDAQKPVRYDIARLSRRCGMRPSSFSTAIENLVGLGKLTLSDNHLSNPRAEKVIETRRKLVEKSSEAATSRWSKVREEPEQNQSDFDADAFAMQCQTDAIPEARSQKQKESPLPPKGEAKKARRKPETALPDGFPDLKALQDAKAKVLDAGAAVKVSAEAERFRNHAAQTDRRARDWMAAWRNWILNAIERAPSLGIVQTVKDEHDPWPMRLRSWSRQEGWNDVDWGPEPGSPGCRVPPEHLPRAAQ